MLWTTGGGSELSTAVDVVGVVIVVESCVSLPVKIVSEGLGEGLSMHLGGGMGASRRSNHWGIRGREQQLAGGSL